MSTLTLKVRPRSCPFCGAQCAVFSIKPHGGQHYPAWKVKCTNGYCSAESRPMSTMDRVLQWWNRRFVWRGDGQVSSVRYDEGAQPQLLKGQS